MAYGSGGYGGAPIGGSGGGKGGDVSTQFYGKVRVSGYTIPQFYGKVRVSGCRYVDFYGRVQIGTGKYITSYFHSIGTPITGLTPTLDIWNVNGYHEVDDDSMSEIGNGWYVYLFANYVEGTEYLRTTDGGSGLPLDERYHFNGHTLPDVSMNVDWSNGEKQQIRDALGVDGVKNAAVNGQLQTEFTAVKGVTFDTNDDSLEAIRNRGDAAWTTATGFATPGEYTDILLRIVGLNQENQYIDNTVYIGNCLMSARLRTYSVAGSVGTVNDVLATYTITATYSGSDMTSYSMVKV